MIGVCFSTKTSSYALFSGQFDNILLHGIPSQFQYKELHRSNAMIKEEQNPGKELSCTKYGIDNFFFDTNVHYCLNRGLNDMILERNISKFQSLNNISTFKLFVSFSTPTDSATPYFSVQMVGNNHGSRVDVVVELRDPKVTSDELSVFDRFIYETVLFNTFSFPNMHQLRKISEFTESLLWTQRELKQKEKLNFTLGLESRFTNVAEFQISGLEWKEAIQLSTHNPAHCVSVSGLISSGYLSEGHQGN